MNKYRISALAIALVAIALVVGLLLAGRHQTAVGAAVPASNVLNVKDLQADPTAFTGRITVTGVVAAKAQGPAVEFALVDTAEAKLCKSTGCASFYLPVRFNGPLPKKWDEVTVSGVLAGQSGLQADTLDVVRHLNL